MTVNDDRLAVSCAYWILIPQAKTGFRLIVVNFQGDTVVLRKNTQHQSSPQLINLTVTLGVSIHQFRHRCVRITSDANMPWSVTATATGD